MLAVLWVGAISTSAELRCKQSSVLAGRPFFQAIFDQLKCHVHWYYSDGEYVMAPAVVATVSGPANAILLGERTALNIITRWLATVFSAVPFIMLLDVFRACGIATLTRQCVDTARQAGSTVRVAATRKTTPGFRLVEKYAVVVGGGG